MWAKQCDEQRGELKTFFPRDVLWELFVYFYCFFNDNNSYIKKYMKLYAQLFALLWKCFCICYENLLFEYSTEVCGKTGNYICKKHFTECMKTIWILISHIKRKFVCLQQSKHKFSSEKLLFYKYFDENQYFWCEINIKTLMISCRQSCHL